MKHQKSSSQARASSTREFCLTRPYVRLQSSTPQKAFLVEFYSVEVDDMHTGVLFHVHIQLTDRFGKTYFDWTVYKSFPEIVDLHRHCVRVRMLLPIISALSY
jgi:hypothetical protein